jgi:hypothetical protein
MRKLFTRIGGDRLFWVILIASPLVVLAGHGIIAMKQARIQEIAAELASSKQFFGGPGPNHSGTKMFFAQTSDTGITAYLVDTATGQKKFLFEHEQSHLQGVGLMGWSPDDKLFAYSIRSPSGKIVICDGNTGEPLDTVSESKIILESVWLSNQALVYVNSDQNWSVVRAANKEWSRSRLFTANIAEKTPVPSTASKRKRLVRRTSPADLVKNLAAISPSTVAWQFGDAMWIRTAR